MFDSQLIFRLNSIIDTSVRGVICFCQDACFQLNDSHIPSPGPAPAWSLQTPELSFFCRDVFPEGGNCASVVIILPPNSEC